MRRCNVAEAAGDDEAFVIGGAELYREALPRADRLYCTRVRAQRRGRHAFSRTSIGTNGKLVESNDHDADDKNEYHVRFETSRASMIHGKASETALRLGHARRRADDRLPRRGVGRAGPRRPQAVRVPTLESAQAGLSWLVVLRKREAYRRAFADFDPEKVARFTDKRIEKLLADPGIIRNRLKIAAAITNAR